MSTTIRNGYRLAPGTSPFEFARRVRDIIDPIRDRADAEMLAGLACPCPRVHSALALGG
jgi:hypothetical protein